MSKIDQCGQFTSLMPVIFKTPRIDVGIALLLSPPLKPNKVLTAKILVCISNEVLVGGTPLLIAILSMLMIQGPDMVTPYNTFLGKVGGTFNHFTSIRVYS